jgi:hypothetical protein
MHNRMRQDPEDRLRYLFEGREAHIDERQIKRAVRFGSFLMGLLFLFTFGLAVLVPYTDFLWYAHDVRHPEVFNTAYRTRGSLFLMAFLGSWAVLYFSLRKALSLSLVYLRKPDGVGQVLLSHAMGWVQERGGTVVRLVAPIVAFFSALGFSNEWNTFLLARHPQVVGKVDPTYGIDLGFFMFTLPWYRALTNYAFALLFLTTALTIGLYVGLQAMAMLARIELSRPHVRMHISLIVGATLLVFALQSWLKTYELGLVDSGQFTGAGYAAMQAFGAQRIFAVLLAIVGVAVIVGGRVGRPFAILTFGGAAAAAWYFLAMVAYPGLVQRFSVDPNRLAKEAPFAAKAIQMTRFGYGLDAVRTRDITTQDTPTQEAIQASSATLANMRLWDPEILRQSLEGLQSFRSYYTFHDVDVDRYIVDGKPTMVMLAPRDVSLSGLDPAAQNWTNKRLRFTHGYGIAMSRVNAATPEGDPAFLARDVPLNLAPGVRIDQPRLYFSDYRDPRGLPTDEYALVRTGEKEFDFETAEGTASHEWAGNRGIPIGGLLTRLAYSIVLADGNLLVSPNISSNSRLLTRRNVIERASKVYPFLRFDLDPYVVLLNGRLVWVLDGYTTSDMVPYSSSVIGLNGDLNYIRNSVKATVDAYTGEVRAFAVTPNEPLLRAYRKIYPGLIRDASEVPPGLTEHFRYPEDLFSLQTQQLAQYHVSDPRVFLSNSDAWNIPRERGLNGATEPIRPYYVQMHLPGEGEAGFFLMRPFTPNGKPNMSGWIAAHCDPQRYGELTLYRFRGQFPDGPELMESKFNSTPEVANINRQFNNEQSEIVVGNMLVIPIGNSVMYAESLFLKSKTSGIQAAPRLTKVILALNKRVVVGDTYEEALRKLLATAPPELATTPPAAPGRPGPATPPTRQAPPEVREALRLMDEADAALRRGDFGRFGDLQKQARAKLQEMTR